MTNPFAETEWKTSEATILPVGDHVVTIDSIDGTGNSSGGYPQLEIEMSGEQGKIKDWMVLIPSATFRPAALFAACGLEKPEDNQWTEEGTGFRIDPRYTNQCIGKQVGVQVRSEPKYNDPGKTRTVVRGYITAAQVNTDLPGDTTGFEPTTKAPGTADDNDIPF